MHLTPNGFVAIRSNMLTYFVYAPLSNQIDGSPFGVRYYFLDRFGDTVSIIQSTIARNDPNSIQNLLDGHVTL
jgi:hypothetical protein